MFIGKSIWQKREGGIKFSMRELERGSTRAKSIMDFRTVETGKIIVLMKFRNYSVAELI